MPTAKSGFLEEVLSQPFFIPGVATIITGVLLFVVLFAGMEAQDLQYFVYYQTILGIYLGTMMIYFVVAVSAVKIPIWFLFGTSLFMVLLLSLGIPFYLLSTFFISPLIDEFMESDIFLELFIGHFVGAGLLEELFKSIPIWLVIFLGSRFANLNLPGFVNGKLNPTVAILIGAASAVAFIIIETLGGFVPEIIEDYGEDFEDEQNDEFQEGDKHASLEGVPSLVNAMWPSAMGMTFHVRRNVPRIKVSITGSFYEMVMMSLS